MMKKNLDEIISALGMRLAVMEGVTADHTKTIDRLLASADFQKEIISKIIENIRSPADTYSPDLQCENETLRKCLQSIADSCCNTTAALQHIAKDTLYDLYGADRRGKERPCGS